jgi:hypothetical protein
MYGHKQVKQKGVEMNILGDRYRNEIIQDVIGDLWLLSRIEQDERNVANVRKLIDTLSVFMDYARTYSLKES